MVTDTLPAGLDRASAQADAGARAPSPARASPATSAHSPRPPVGASRRSSSKARSTPPRRGVVTNTATVTSSTPDPDPSQNTASATATVVRQADLHLDKLADTDPLVAGTTVGYTITVTNAGPSDADGVVVTDAAPAGARSGQLGIRSVRARDHPSPAPSAPWPRTRPAWSGWWAVSTRPSPARRSRTPPGRHVDDPNPGDETATLTSNVVQQADLAVTKLPDATTPSAGSQLTYTITVANNGPSDAVNAAFTDDLPLPPVAFVLPSQGDVTCGLTGLQVRCNVAIAPCRREPHRPDHDPPAADAARRSGRERGDRRVGHPGSRSDEQRCERDRERGRRRRPEDHQDDRDQPDRRWRAGDLPARRAQPGPVDRAERPRQRPARAERHLHLGFERLRRRTKWRTAPPSSDAASARSPSARRPARRSR